MRGMMRDSVVEIFDRKIIWLFGIVTLIAVGIIIFSGEVAISTGPGQAFDVDVQELNEALGNPLMRVFTSFVSFMVILSVLATAGIIPSMLVPGRAEFYLSKPMSRSSLLMNKFLGTLVAYGLIVVVCGLIGYGALYFVHGVTSPNVVWVFVLNLISLFIWLSITSFAGITFGSTSMAIVAAALVWVAQLMLQGREMASALIESKFVQTALDVLYYVIPNTGELSDLTVAVATDSRISSWVPLWSSCAFAVVLLVVTLIIFNRRNY